MSAVYQHLRLARFSLFAAMVILPAMRAGVDAQISVAPTTVVIESRNPFGEFIVANRSGVAQEVTIGFQFGFPVSDEHGEISMEYEATERGAPFDLGNRVRAFPTRFVLPPGERQTVRLMIRPGGDAPHGVYWTRIVTTSNPSAADIDPQQVTEEVAARIIFRIRQITTLLFKQGEVNTGVLVHRFDARAENDNVVIDAKLEREGNAPFIGSTQVRIFDRGGQEVFNQVQNLALYFELLRRHTAPLENLPPGEYRAELVISSTRDDISRDNLIQIEPIRRDVAFTIRPEDRLAPVEAQPVVIDAGDPPPMQRDPTSEKTSAATENSDPPPSAGEGQHEPTITTPAAPVEKDAECPPPAAETGA